MVYIDIVTSVYPTCNVADAYGVDDMTISGISALLFLHFLVGICTNNTTSNKLTVFPLVDSC